MEHSDPQLSILIPAFNCQSTILETLQSLDAIETGWEHVSEVIVCDDFSTDDTATVVENATFRHFTVKLLRHARNQGEGACYATMVAALDSGVEWFLILHSDDLALPCFIDRNLAIAQTCAPSVAAVSSNYYVFGQGEERLAHSPAEDKIVWRGGAADEIRHTAFVGTWWHVSGSLVRRSAWAEHGGRDTRLPQLGDWDLMLRWQSANLRIGHSLLPTTRYRLSDGSISSQSYLQFRDIRERAEVICRNRSVFPLVWRLKIGGMLALTGVRRVIKLTLQRQPRVAARGLGVTGAALVQTISGSSGQHPA